MSRNILVMGALGQVGSELTLALRENYGNAQVVASDIRLPSYADIKEGPFEIIDCMDKKRITEVVHKYKVGVIYHLPALLSASAEKYPQKAFQVNLLGLFHTLEVAREQQCAVFTPSSIGVFSEHSSKPVAMQETIMRPNTMYGLTKLSGELLCDYYYKKYNVDTRGVRYPGIISCKTFPGGGTTDYAVEIFTAAHKEKTYQSYLEPTTCLDMIYMPDAIKAAMSLMEAPAWQLRFRNAYNITAMQFDVATLAEEIRKHIATFTVSYKVDPIRQQIANSWPDRLDDSPAREDWGWLPDYNFATMVQEMLAHMK